MTTSLRSSILVITSLAVLGGAHQAHALTLLSDDRSVSISRRVLPLPPATSTATPEIPFGPFHEPGGVAGQDSELSLVSVPGSGDILSGSASGSARGGASFDASTHSRSDFTIQFRVDGISARIELSGVLDGTHSRFLSFSNGVELRAGSTLLYDASMEFEDDVLTTTPFAFDTVLGPGEYELTAFSSAGGGIPGTYSTGTYSLDFAVVENVPEPGTALFMAIGTTGLACMRRRAGVRALTPHAAM